MTKDEALKLALEALNNLAAWNDGEVGGHMDEPYSAEVARRTITAIKETLAQPEPVAWEQFYPDMGKPKLAHLPPPECKTEAEKTAYAFGWFKSMEAQRTWVRLTDEEISDLWCKVSNTDFVTADTHVFAQAIEAKLRSKND